MMAGTTLFPSILPTRDDQDDRDVDEVLEAGECPWCDDYAGDNPKQHAPRAHADEWSEYTED